jgi:6-pyruvoyl-tetrahydropterin synthase
MVTNENNIQLLFSDYFKKIYDKEENRCIKKTNVKLDYSKVHTGNGEWQLMVDKEIYGKCNNEPSHGHNYDIILKLKSNQVDESGIIKNFYEIKKIFKEKIDDVYDHTYLNNAPIFNHNIVPTAENMCYIFYKILKFFLIVTAYVSSV